MLPEWLFGLKSPAFTTTALLTLALSVGANVVAFGVLNALLLRPLEAPQPAGLYNVVHAAHGYDNQSYSDYVDSRPATRHSATWQLIGWSKLG